VKQSDSIKKSDNIKKLKSVKNLIQINQSVYDKEIKLKIQLINKSNVVQTHDILADQMTQTQRIITDAEKANKIE